MEERKDKLLFIFFISAIFLHSLSNTVVENIFVPCGSSYDIRIKEDPSTWISSAWVFERNNGNSFVLLYYDVNNMEYSLGPSAARETTFIYDYGLHYLSLYQMSIMLNNSIIEFTSYSEKELLGNVLVKKKIKIMITDSNIFVFIYV
ncbi:hypothetical protein HZS_7242 [Henneguya salminicola]|nr:hypothetical protein HZS_7242 [Henneguya salminicola]